MDALATNFLDYARTSYPKFFEKMIVKLLMPLAMTAVTSFAKRQTRLAANHILDP